MKQRVATKLVGKTNRELPFGVCLLVRKDSQALSFSVDRTFSHSHSAISWVLTKRWDSHRRHASGTDA